MCSVMWCDFDFALFSFVAFQFDNFKNAAAFN